MMDDEAWGKKLKDFRLSAQCGSQGELTERLSELGTGINIPSNEISRYESGKRVPIDRSRHLDLIMGLVRLGGIQTLEKANEWLALGGQGYLTPEEELDIFESVSTKSEKGEYGSPETVGNVRHEQPEDAGGIPEKPSNPSGSDDSFRGIQISEIKIGGCAVRELLIALTVLLFLGLSIALIYKIDFGDRISSLTTAIAITNAGYTPTPPSTDTPIPTPTETPTSVPTHTITANPTNTSLSPTNAPPPPTDTPTPSDTPLPPTTDSPPPPPADTPTCSPTATPKPTPPDYLPLDLDIVSLKLRVGNAEMVITQQEQLVQMKSGDDLEVLEIVFNSSTDRPLNENVAGEAYVRKVGLCPDDFDWNDGRFAYGVPIRPGNQSITPFINVTGGSDAWMVTPGWSRLVIALVHYFPYAGDGAVVNARFFINLRVQ